MRGTATSVVVICGYKDSGDTGGWGVGGGGHAASKLGHRTVSVQMIDRCSASPAALCSFPNTL